MQELISIVTNFFKTFIKQIFCLELSTTTTEKTETKEDDGAVVTTTTKGKFKKMHFILFKFIIITVTTRTIKEVPKQLSPFDKFKQLDKQNTSSK